MDILKEIKDKLTANPDVTRGRGLESVVTHIEIAERYHEKAKLERDEHLYTDVIYRTNHAFEGILKEAYLVLEGKDATTKTPHEIEAYLLEKTALQARVVDLLTNYRQNWRNPSTHDYQLFFSQQESFLAIVTVSAFVSILLDHIIQKLVYTSKLSELENAAVLARDRMADYEDLSPITKVAGVLSSFATYYAKAFEEMSRKPRVTVTAEMAAFIKRVGPDLNVTIDPEFTAAGKTLRFDMAVEDRGVRVLVDARDPKPRDQHDAYFNDAAAVKQLADNLTAIGLKDGIIFHYPGRADDVIITVTSSTSWPKDLNLRKIEGDDPAIWKDVEHDLPVDLGTDNQA